MGSGQSPGYSDTAAVKLLGCLAQGEVGSIKDEQVWSTAGNREEESKLLCLKQLDPGMALVCGNFPALVRNLEFTQSRRPPLKTRLLRNPVFGGSEGQVKGANTR